MDPNIKWYQALIALGKGFAIFVGACLLALFMWAAESLRDLLFLLFSER